MLWMVASGLLFTLLNALMKKLAHEVDPWLVGFLRYALGALVMVAPVLRLGAGAWRTAAPRLQALRGGFHAAGMLLWFAALPLVGIAEITAIGFSGPLFVCLGAALLLGERMTGARWAAVLAGSAGVLLVVDPLGPRGFAGVSPGMLLMLASAPLFAASFLVAKVLTRHDRAEVMVLWQHVAVAALLAPFALAFWAPLAAWQWALLVACGFLGAGGHYCVVRAFRVAELSAVQPLRFLELVWASIAGLVLFGAEPAASTLAGAAVIFTSTLWLANRESRRVAA